MPTTSTLFQPNNVPLLFFHPNFATSFHKHDFLAVVCTGRAFEREFDDWFLFQILNEEEECRVLFFVSNLFNIAAIYISLNVDEQKLFQPFLLFDEGRYTEKANKKQQDFFSKKLFLCIVSVQELYRKRISKRTDL